VSPEWLDPDMLLLEDAANAVLRDGMATLMYSILSKKRDGGRHTPDEIRALVSGYVGGEVADYQMSAWLMAVCINGLDGQETLALTAAMVESGETLDLSSLPGVTVDKHSTGGVGDKTTLVLAPLLASAGLTVVKMSGRGLGITGGTLDKLESIPGFNVNLTKEQFLDQARKIGCVIAGQTADLVPADKKMYALRDVTATVESIPLIAASVMSKKIACGASTILLDVKVGSGAFMKDIQSARELARTMIGIGERAGRRTIAAITGMDQPLGMAVGNAVEVAEAIQALSGGGPPDLRDLCLELGSMLVIAAGLANSPSQARNLLERLLSSGAALEKFRQVVSAQGGDPRVADDPTILPQVRSSAAVLAPAAGYVQSLDASTIGRVAATLGAGRQKKEDTADRAAGVLLAKKVADRVQPGEQLARLLWSREIEIEPALRLAESAFRIGPAAPSLPPLVLETIAS